MMRIKLMIAVTGVAIGFSMLGCSNNLQTENTLLKKENEELKKKVQVLEKTIGQLRLKVEEKEENQNDLERHF